MSDGRKFIGPNTMRRAEGTRWWKLARALDAVLYDGRTVYSKQMPSHDGRWETGLKEETHSRHFFAPAKVYVGDDHPKSLAFDSKYADTEKLLREIMHELERLAVLEVT